MRNPEQRMKRLNNRAFSLFKEIKRRFILEATFKGFDGECFIPADTRIVELAMETLLKDLEARGFGDIKESRDEAEAK